MDRQTEVRAAKVLVYKVLLASLMFVVLITIAAWLSGSSKSLWDQVLSMSGMGIAVVVLGALVAAVGLPTLAIDQWILRHGGTDNQWWIFPNEPPGLVKLREEFAEQKLAEQSATEAKQAGGASTAG